MSSFATSLTVPAPVAQVVPAAVYAANALGHKVQNQGPYAMKCQTSLMRIVGNRVTIEIQVGGIDGAAQISIRASNFGLGPIQTGVCRDEANKLIASMVGILQGWAAQAAPAQQ